MGAVSIAARVATDLRRYWSLYLVQIVCAAVMWFGAEQIDVNRANYMLWAIVWCCAIGVVWGWSGTRIKRRIEQRPTAPKERTHR